MIRHFSRVFVAFRQTLLGEQIENKRDASNLKRSMENIYGKSQEYVFFDH